MKLDPKNDYGEFYWVAHPNASPSNEHECLLVKERYRIEILGGVLDDEACYEYDEWALCELDGKYYLLSTSGCSCPSPSETWRIEIGPATIAQIKAHVQSGAYDGYTLPKKKETDFLKLLDSVEPK